MVYWCKWCSGVLVNMQLCLEMMKSHIKTDAKCIWFSFCNRISHFLGQALSWNVTHAVTCLPLCAPGVMTSLQGSLLPLASFGLSLCLLPPCVLVCKLVTPLRNRPVPQMSASAPMTSSLHHPPPSLLLPHLMTSCYPLRNRPVSDTSRAFKTFAHLGACPFQCIDMLLFWFGCQWPANKS